MTDNRRKRNLQKEMRYNVYWDFGILIVSSILICLISPSIPKVGSRNIVFLGIAFAVSTGMLMV
ncbi:MAG: hypothetical protein IJ365_00945, partial [Clostridia bacterium]|nr:hypothetical protein [Clostridia bacterium]